MIQLGNDNLKIRSFKVEDRNRLAVLCNNKNIWNNLRDFIPHPYTEEDAMEFIQFSQNEIPQKTFAIEHNGELVGCIGLVAQSDIYKYNAEMGYWVAEPYWGMGIASKAVELITAYAFHDLSLMRIYAGVFDSNKASQRVMEKNGFKLDSILEKSVFKNGQFCNEYRYSKINVNF